MLCFFGVKCVGDVLAGKWSSVLSLVKGVGDVLAGLDVELGAVFYLVEELLQLSRASVTCLLDVELLLCFLWCQGRR